MPELTSSQGATEGQKAPDQAPEEAAPVQAPQPAERGAKLPANAPSAGKTPAAGDSSLTHTICPRKLLLFFYQRKSLATACHRAHGGPCGLAGALHRQVRSMLHKLQLLSSMQHAGVFCGQKDLPDEPPPSCSRTVVLSLNG